MKLSITRKKQHEFLAYTSIAKFRILLIKLMKDRSDIHDSSLKTQLCVILFFIKIFEFQDYNDD